MIPIFIKKMLDEATDAVEFTKGKGNALLKKWDFNLNAAGEQTINLQGNFVYGFDSSDSDANINIQFSRKDSSADYFSIVKGVGYIHPFDKIHVSWSAQVGETLTLYIGNLAPNFIGILDNRSQISLVGALNDILGELQGETAPQGFALVDLDAQPHLIIASNTTRKSVILTADPLNVGRVYLGYDNTVAANKYFGYLDPGDVYMTDDYRGAIWGYPATSGDNVGYGEV